MLEASYEIITAYAYGQANELEAHVPTGCCHPAERVVCQELVDGVFVLPARQDRLTPKLGRRHKAVAELRAYAIARRQQPRHSPRVRCGPVEPPQEGWCRTNAP